MDQSIKKDLLYPELSYQIVGILFSVYNELGCEHKEQHYQKAIAVELQKQSLLFKEQVHIDLKYKDQSIGSYYLDFLIAGKIILEIKKNNNFSPKHIQQVVSYLKAFDIKLGILANFTSDGIKYKRILNTY